MKNAQLRQIWVASLVVLIASACVVDEPLSGAGPRLTQGPSGEQLPDRPSKGNEGDEYLFDIAREVPSYGGHRQTPDGAFIVSSTDSNDFAAVRSAILSRISNRRIFSVYTGRLPRVSVIKAEYSIRQLAVWRDSIMANRRAFNWAMIDLDEGRNRVSIGVRDGTDYSENSEFAREAARRAIPMAALNIAPFGEVQPSSKKTAVPLTATHLHHVADSLAGGYRYVWNKYGTFSGCTIGFVANISNGTQGFISASHCSQQKWDDDTTSIFQPDASVTPVTGREEWDMAPGTCPYFWSCNHYRFSDANLNVVDTSARDVKLGYLVRPASRNAESGSDLNISTGNPYIEVVGETSSILQGSIIDGIGSTTGWTYSYVMHTCVTYDDAPWPFNGQALRCAYITDHDWEDGDSGGPVFYYSGGTATAAGIIAARTIWPHHGIFSKFMYVRNEIQSSGLTFSITPTGTPATYYPWSTSISGAATIQSNASCHYMASSNLSYTSIEWKVNGTVIGTNWDVYHSSSSSFLLEVEATDGINVAQGSQFVTVWSEAGTCYDQ